MDRYIDRVPVRTVGSGTKKYNDRIWYDLLSSIRIVNGEPVVGLKKSMLQEGDQVTFEYKNKTYQGVVEAPSASASTHAEPDQQCLEENMPHAGRRSPRKRRPSKRPLGTTPEKKAKKSPQKPTPEKKRKKPAKKPTPEKKVKKSAKNQVRIKVYCLPMSPSCEECIFRGLYLRTCRSNYSVRTCWAVH